MRRSVTLLSFALLTLVARAGEVQVAVAANFAGPLARLGEGFTAATGHTLKVSAGATGKFYTQIVAGAPFEVPIA
jgi:molybdate transport system substrate-binding protein